LKNLYAIALRFDLPFSRVFGIDNGRRRSIADMETQIGGERRNTSGRIVRDWLNVFTLGSTST
jgi:hypothetical protein